MRNALLLLLVPLALACGDTPADEATPADTTDDTTAQDTPADSDPTADSAPPPAESPTDSDAGDTTPDPLAACNDCQTDFGNYMGGCSSACAGAGDFCSQQMCRYNCQVQATGILTTCLTDAGPTCADGAANASCQEACLDTWWACAGGSPCPGGFSGTCEDELIACFGTCG